MEHVFVNTEILPHKQMLLTTPVAWDCCTELLSGIKAAVAESVEAILQIHLTFVVALHDKTSQINLYNCKLLN